MDTLAQMAAVAGAAGLFTFEDSADASEDERKGCYARLSPGRARASWMLIAAERPEAQTPEPPKPQFPDVGIIGAVRRRPILNNFGAHLMPTQEAGNFFTMPKYEADAIEPPYTPCPAPQLTEEPISPHAAEAKRALEAGVAKKKEFGVEEHNPSESHLARAQLREDSGR